MTRLSVNRYLEDIAMDRIDHALGRPLDPIAQTIRNHYAAPADTAVEAEMRASPYWLAGGRGSGLQFFSVTNAGRQALLTHLRAIKDRHRAFVISFDGHQCPVVATSAGKARYECWLGLRDCRPDLSFKDFCRSTKVRAA